jgi:hypothetical protein
MSRSLITFGLLLALGLLGTSGARPQVETGRVKISLRLIKRWQRSRFIRLLGRDRTGNFPA